MSHKKQEQLTFYEHLCSPLVFGGVCVAHHLGFWCCATVLLCFVCLRPVSCHLCAQCSQYLWIVHSWLPLRFSLTFIKWLIEEKLLTLPEYPSLLPVCLGRVYIVQPLVFCAVFCRSLFACSSPFFWWFNCLSCDCLPVRLLSFGDLIASPAIVCLFVSFLWVI